MFLGPSFNKWCIGVLRTKCGQETAQGPSLQSEDFLSQQVYALGCLHEWMMLMCLNLLNETWFCLILCTDILSTLVCFCCLPDFLIFCNLKCGSEHAQELRAPDAAKFARERHTRGHRRSYGQNGPWWQFITPVCRANAQQMIDDTCLLQQDTEFDYRLGKPSAQPFGRKRRAQSWYQWLKSWSQKNTRSIKASIVWALGLLAQSHSSVQHISYDFIITSSSLHITSSILHRYQFGHQLDIQWDHPRGSALQLIQSLANQMPILEGPNLSRPNVSSQTQKSQKVKLQKH